jgi:hypothetical protein
VNDLQAMRTRLSDMHLSTGQIYASTPEAQELSELIQLLEQEELNGKVSRVLETAARR